MNQTNEAAQGAAAIDERHEFEKAMSNLGQAVHYEGDGWYKYPSVCLAWDAWQARAALKAQPAPTEAPTLEDFPVLMKDHNVRQLVNDLRDIAIQFHAAGQLRARRSGAVGQFLDKHRMPKAPTEAAQGDDSARVDALQKLRDLAERVGDDGLWNTAGAMHEAIDVLAAPQPQEKP